MNRIDQLFKSKLAEHRLAPPADGWTKVETRLVKKNSLQLVWRIAAALALIGVLAFAWYGRITSEEPAQSLTLQPETSTPQPDIVEQPTSEVVTLQKATPIASIRKQASKKITNEMVENPSTPGVTELVEPAISIETVVALELGTEASIEKPIVIEFILEPMPTKPVAVADTEPVDSETGIKKILDKALDIKNGEGDFGSLRNVKNELFALDFRKDKLKRN